MRHMRPLTQDQPSNSTHPQQHVLRTAAHLNKALVCTVDLISKNVEQHLTVAVGLQVPAVTAAQQAGNKIHGKFIPKRVMYHAQYNNTAVAV